MLPSDPWTETSDALLTGLTHTLSNRVATVSICAAMVDPATPDAELAGALGAEVRKLEAMLRLFRTLSATPRRVGRPLHLSDHLEQVVALHAHHAELRDVPCELVLEGEVPPVLVSEGSLTRALLVLLSGAKRTAARLPAGRRAVRLTAGGDADQAMIRIALAEAPDASATADLASAAHWASAALESQPGMALDAGDGAVELRLPSLPEGRRLERTAREAR